MGVMRHVKKTQKVAHMTHGHRDLETESAQWANSVKILITWSKYGSVFKKKKSIIFRIRDLINVTKAKRVHCTFLIIVFLLRVVEGMDMSSEYFKYLIFQIRLFYFMGISALFSLRPGHFSYSLFLYDCRTQIGNETELIKPNQTFSSCSRVLFKTGFFVSLCCWYENHLSRKLQLQLNFQTSLDYIQHKEAVRFSESW